MAQSVKAARAENQPLQLDWAVDTNHIEEDAKKVLRHIRPDWPPDQIQFKKFTDGITNKLFGAYLEGSDMKDVVLIRVNGEGTEVIIDREAEVRTFQLLHANKCGPPLFALFKNGMSYGFVQGEPLDEDNVRDERVATLIAQEMVRLHSVQPDNKPPSERCSQFRTKAQAFLNNVPTGFDNEAMNTRFLQSVPSLSALQTELDSICQELESLKMPTVFSHNDLLLRNIVYDSKSKPDAIHFIDFEYAFLNYQAYDIGNHFCEYAGMDEVDYDLYPDKDYQVKWLRRYLQFDFTAKGRSPQDVTDIDVERLYVQTNKCACAAHFFWSLWALIQAKNSSIDFDFLGYSITRLSEYTRRKKEFFPLALP
ncbi:ethanolamine kinase 1-like [Littorina saxatilis]|uniref:ethanolamine kinase n=1 Tax=Littorina saxatilis TaxID=31220 RepID=A0AAN9APL4_9CAEN